MQKAILTKKQIALLKKFGAKTGPLSTLRAHFRHYDGRAYAMATDKWKLVEFEIEAGPESGTAYLTELAEETPILGPEKPIDWRGVFPENGVQLGIFWADSILWAAKCLSPMSTVSAVAIDFKKHLASPILPNKGVKAEITLAKGEPVLDYAIGLTYSVIQEAFKGNPRTFWHGPSRAVIVEHDDCRCLVMPCHIF